MKLEYHSISEVEEMKSFMNMKELPNWVFMALLEEQKLDSKYILMKAIKYADKK